MSKWIVVETTAEDEQALRRIAKTLVRERLAGCAQIGGPIESHYMWEGHSQEAREYRLSLKTAGELFARLERRLLELHPYEVPQVIAIPITGLSDRYEQWLENSLGDPGMPPKS